MTYDSETSRGGFFSSRSSSQHDAVSTTTALSSTFSGDTVALRAGQDIAIKGSNVSAIGDLSLAAARDLSVETAQNTANESHFRSETESGFSASFSGGISYGSSSLEQSAAGQRVTQVASTLAGGDIALSSGRDTTISASNVLADRDLTILAGRNVDILAAANSEAVENRSKSESTSIGVTPGASGRFTAYGKTSASEDGSGSATTQSTTLLSANSGDLTVRAGLDQATQGTGTGNIVTQGADLLAGGTITLSGRAIDLQAVSNETRSHTVAESSSLTVGAALAGPLGSKIAAIGDAIDQAQHTDNGRLQDALVLKAGYDAYKLTQGQEVTSVEATGTTEATTQAAQVAKDARIAQGQDMAGSAGAASASSGIGISVSIGSSKSSSESSTHETQVIGTNLQAREISISASETDLHMAAAKLQAETIALSAKRDVILEAAANQSELTSSSSGFSVSVCWFFCTGVPVIGSVGVSEQSIKHSYLSAVGQSGIAAGDGGFDIKVKGGTELVGAAITSSAAAGDNRLTTASLSSRDLENAQSTQSKSSSLSVGYSGASMLTTLAGNAAQNIMGNLQGNAALPKNSSQSGTTQSVISPATITITGSGDAAKDASSRQTAEQLTARDAASANGSLTNTLTLQQAQALQAEVAKQRENMEAAKLVGAVLSNVVGDLAAKQGWKEGGPEKIALHGMVGLIEAKIGGGSAAAGALGAMSQEVMAPILSDYLKENGFVVGSDEYKALIQLGATLVGTAVGALATGDVQGASTGANAAFVGVTNNYLTHPQITKKQAELAKAKSEEDRKEINARYDAIDAKQRDAAVACVLGGVCGSVMGLTDTRDVKAVLDELNASCAPPRLCSTDAKAGIAELNQLYAKAQALGGVYVFEEWVLGGKIASTALNAVKSVLGVEAGATGVAGAKGAETLVTSEGAANAATAQQLVDSLASKMVKPVVQDTKLSGLMDDLYRDGAKIGTGSTADAVRYEISAGQPVGGVFHAQKAQDYSTALQKWLNDNLSAPFNDRSAASNVLRDLQNALKGK